MLRQQGVDAAILETARGGLLRRGLGVYKADAAVITNIGRDHLGDFGSRSMTFKGGRDECFEGALRGLTRRGYDILVENKNSLYIKAGSETRTCVMRGQYKGDKMVWNVSLSHNAQQLDYSKLSASITEAIDRIYQKKTK